MGGWNEVSLQDLTSYVIGGDWGNNPEELINDSTLAFCIRGSEIKEWRKNKGKTAVIRRIKQSSLDNRKLEKGNILIEISGGGPEQPVGRVLYIDEESLNTEGNLPLVCTNFFRKLQLVDSVYSKYVYYYLHYFYLNGNTISLQGGSNNLRNLKYKDYQMTKIPLPAFTEQKQIAEKLDKLFVQIETIKQSAERIPKLLKNFRQQILTYAVTGKLTEKWRNDNSATNLQNVILWIKEQRIKEVSSKTLKDKLEKIYSDSNSSIDFSIPKQWIPINLDKVCDSFVYGTSAKSENEGKYPVIRMGNIQNGKLDWSDLKYTSDESEYVKYKLNNGDVLFNRTNSPELVGKTTIYDCNKEACYAGYIIKIDSFREYVNPYYLNIVLNSQYAKRWCWKNKSDGVSQSNINAQKLSKFTIPYPSMLEQAIIVERVQSLFNILDDVERRYKALYDKLEKLPQALLCKAFKGELK